ncbi:MAG: twin-arginine translocase subunit TatC [Ferruginibacter sp.]
MPTASLQRKHFFQHILQKKEKKPPVMDFFGHVEALRWHLVRSVIAWLVMVLLIFINMDWVYDNIILAPASQHFISYGALCNQGHWFHLGDAFCMPPVLINFQVTEVNGTFTSAINIAMIGGLIAAFPYICWEIWRFIKPGLSEKEVRYSRNGVFWISFFFFTGAIFGYYLLAPFTFNFLASFSLSKSGIIQYRPSVNDYIDSLTNLILGCGIAFELPVLCLVLTRIGIISGNFLKKNFKFAFVVILIVAAVITPSPDWTSQFLVAVPLLFLYGVSVLLATRVERQKIKEIR